MAPSRRNPKRVSLSEINTYQECQQRWYWEYIRRLELPLTPRPLRVGSAIHEYLAGYYNGRTSPIIPAHYTLSKSFDEYVAFQDMMGNEIPTKEKALLEADMKTAQIVAKLYPEVYQNDDFVVEGVEVSYEDPIVRVVDLITRDKGSDEWWVWEHKSTSQKVEDYINTLYTPNLEGPISVHCVELAGKKCEGIIYNIIGLKNATPEFHREHIPISRQRKDRVRQIIEKFSDIILYLGENPSLYGESNIFPVYAWHCSRCPFEPLCSAQLDGVDVEDVINQKYTRGG